MVLMCAKLTGSEAEPHSNSTWYASWLRSSSSSSDFIKAVMLSVGWNTGRAASQESWNVREFGKETDGSFQQTHTRLSLRFYFFPFFPVSHFAHRSLSSSLSIWSLFCLHSHSQALILPFPCFPFPPLKLPPLIFGLWSKCSVAFSRRLNLSTCSTVMGVKIAA